MSLDVCRAENIKYSIRGRTNMGDADDAPDIDDSAICNGILDREANLKDLYD